MKNKVGDPQKPIALNHYKQLGARGKNKNILPGPGPDYKLNISDKSKMLKKDLEMAQSDSSVTTSSGSMAIPDIPTPSVVSDAKEVLDVIDKVEDTKKAVEQVKKITKNEKQTIKKPALFFVGGLNLLGDLGNVLFEDGMKSMSNSMDKSKYYAWDQKDEMVEEILKRTNDQKVILVGHGMGADTVVEVAQELNTLDNKFRSIDLLVTLNSKGLNNDFIPQNVVKNLNYLTADNGFTDDGPNIALSYERTEVKNFLRPESHNSLDDSTDIQIQIIDEINKLI